MGDSSWASEVRDQAAYDIPSSSQDTEKPATGPATMPADQYKKIDQNFVTVLAFFFVAIFAEGLLVAGSVSNPLVCVLHSFADIVFVCCCCCRCCL